MKPESRFSGGDCSGERPMPIDLALLGVQLRHEAQRLGELDPGDDGGCRRQVMRRIHVRRIWRRGLWAAGAAASLGVAVLLMVGRSGSPPSTRSGAAEPASLAVAAPSESVPNASGPSRPLGRAEESGSRAAVLLPTANGPELEGLLDLWETEGQPQPRVSI